MQFRRGFFLLGVAALFIHAGAVALVVHRTGRLDSYALRSLDSAEYYLLARNLIDHGVFSQGSAGTRTPDTWRTPGYPSFLAGAMLVLGDRPAGLILYQHLAGVAGALVFFAIAARFMAMRRAGLAAVIVLLEPYHLFYAFWLLSTAFFTLLLLLTWWVWEMARARVALGHFVLLGCLCGFLVLTWPGAVLVPVAAGAGVLFLTPGAPHFEAPPRRAPWPHRLAALALLVLFSALPVAAWMVRNRVVAGHFGLSHQSGIVLAYFKATEVELWRQGRTEDRYLETSLSPSLRDAPHTVWDKIDSELCERMPGNRCVELHWSNLAQGNRTSLDSFEISGALARIGWEMLTASPGSAIACGLSRAVENLVFPLSLAVKPAKGADMNRAKAFVLGGAYLFLTIAALAGALRNRRNGPAIYFPVACGIALALTTAPQIDPRFRVPLIPFLAFLAVLPARREEQ